MELNEWGIPSKVLKIYDGYLSSTQPLNNGILQCSSLSVVLYTVYANSMPKTIEKIPGIDYVGIYADNIFVVASGTPDEVIANLDTLDKKVHQWAVSRGATVPVEKAELLHVCRKRNCITTTIPIRNISLQITGQMRINGLIFTGNLLWNARIKHIAHKLSEVNNFLKLICTRNKVRHIEVDLNISRTLVIGAIQHCLTIYGVTSKNNISSVNISLNNFLRTAPGLLRTTPTLKLRRGSLLCRIQYYI